MTGVSSVCDDVCRGGVPAAGADVLRGGPHRRRQAGREGGTSSTARNRYTFTSHTTMPRRLCIYIYDVSVDVRIVTGASIQVSIHDETHSRMADASNVSAATATHASVLLMAALACIAYAVQQ